MRSPPIICLTTDFGADSPYVAEMKGVLLGICPDARLIDVTHTIPAYDVVSAEIALRRTAHAFPLGTIHLVVVDPGVGGARRPIAVGNRGMYFVGPDNGVLGRMVDAPDAEIVVLDRCELFRDPVSQTFHGRDVFSPVAAEIARGALLAEVGTRATSARGSLLPVIRRDGARWTGCTVGADAFGNLFTNLPAAPLEDGAVFVFDGAALPLVSCYEDAPANRLFAIVGSDGYLEVSMRRASAANHVGRAIGVTVECRVRETDIGVD